jgi:hypothetical protein
LRFRSIEILKLQVFFIVICFFCSIRRSRYVAAPQDILLLDPSLAKAPFTHPSLAKIEASRREPASEE